uniref:DUF4434 domain-containing protein n=1 Tax=Nonomuraea pusilla TaxID=46177 RepID=UPI0006E26B42|nr:DUF4434 domain-containing protein [Nonomuraea pusilla]
MHRILWVVAVVVAAAFVVVPVASSVEGCPARDTRVLARYPITGYWVPARADPCVTRRMVESIHAVGGDTLITFGPRFETRPGPAFDACEADGRPCAQVPGKVVRRVYAYETSEEFGEGLLRCPGTDRRIDSGGRVYYRVGLGACDDQVQDIVLVSTDGDGLGNLVTEAQAYGMTVYPGLPAAPQLRGKPWEPDPEHTAALAAFTRLVLGDYARRFGGSAAFGGVYQSFELAARDRAPGDPIIALYAAQHAVVASALPGKKIVVSPYIDARRGRGFPPALTEQGVADIAATRAGAPMAIAVQDGRGTGKVPVHAAGEASERVAPRLAPVVGDVANDQAYYGPTADYMRTAARRVPAGVELWVNVEAFEPTQVDGECGRVDPPPLRGRTTKHRLDQQIMAAGGYAAKIISYGWEPFFTCQARPDAPSLSDDIASGWRQPIIVNAVRKDMDGRAGVLVEGYNLRGGTLRFLAPGRPDVVAEQEWYGRDRLESAWAPYPTAGPGTSIIAVNGWGEAATSAYTMPS